MNPITEICNLKDCTIRILDLTQDSNLYVKENVQFFKDCDITNIGYINMAKNRYKYSDTVTIDVIVKVTLDSTDILTTLVSPHTYLDRNGNTVITHLDENYYLAESDGYYLIYHLILPVYNENFGNGDNFKKLLKEEEFVYYSAAYEKNLVTFYKYYYDDKKVVKESISTECMLKVCNLTVLDTFVICNLTDCYISLSKSILNNCNFRCILDNDEDATFKRDFVWMTLNVIKYLVEKGDYLEAERILEKVNYCGGFCNNTSSSSSSGCNCGRSSSYYSTTSYAGCGCNKTVKKSSGCGCGK